MEDKDQKSINLMPEDLRSKEDSVLAKKKSDFDFDLVLPDNQAQPARPKSGTSFWQKISLIFKKPISYFAQPKKEKDKKHDDKNHHDDKSKSGTPDMPKPVKPEFHLPTSNEKTSLTVDYSKKEPEKDMTLPVKEEKKSEPKSDKSEKKDGQSFWDKFKKLFTAKKKYPKIERAANKEIAPRQLREEEEIPKTAPSPEIKFEKAEDDILPKIPEVPKPEPAKEIISEVKQAEIKQEQEPSKFVIPQLRPSEYKSEPDKTHKEPEKEEKVSRFHQPQPRIRARFLDSGGGVDLIPTAAKTRSWRQVSKLVLVAFVGSAIILGIFYGYLFYRSKNVEGQKNTRIDQISDLEKQILTYEELNNDISDLGDEIRHMHFLLSFHFYWSNFFTQLEKYTIPEVHYEGLSAGNSGALTLRAVADDFDSVARQIKVFEQEDAKRLVIATDVSGANYSESDKKVSFDITLVLNPFLFIYDENYMNIGN